MIYTYSAIFKDDKQGNCYISIPNLQYETNIDYSSTRELREKAANELGFALWLYDEDGKQFPNPSTISSQCLSDEEYISFVSCDYERFKQSITVKEFPI